VLGGDGYAHVVDVETQINIFHFNSSVSITVSGISVQVAYNSFRYIIWWVIVIDNLSPHLELSISFPQLNG